MKNGKSAPEDEKIERNHNNADNICRAMVARSSNHFCLNIFVCMYVRFLVKLYHLVQSLCGHLPRKQRSSEVKLIPWAPRVPVGRIPLVLFASFSMQNLENVYILELHSFLLRISRLVVLQSAHEWSNSFGKESMQKRGNPLLKYYDNNKKVKYNETWFENNDKRRLKRIHITSE
jgi:hypothetical protein